MSGIILILAFLLVAISCVSAARTQLSPPAPPPPKPRFDCNDIKKLITGPDCIHFINIPSSESTPSKACCADSSSIENLRNYPDCLCRIQSKPNYFDTPINASRIIDLLQFCGSNHSPTKISFTNCEVSDNATNILAPPTPGSECQSELQSWHLNDDNDWGHCTSCGNPTHCSRGSSNSVDQSSCFDAILKPVDTARSASEVPKRSTPDLNTELKIIIGLCSGIGVSILVFVLFYSRKIFSSFKFPLWRRSVVVPTKNMESLLEKYGCNFLQRYKYTDIKKMTDSFKDTLGQGGFGCVYKGVQKDGRLVAIKVLNVSKGDQEGFMNEVITIGRTNHVNIVSLLGFCIDGAKRALVYEYMKNGSLERFIYNEKIENTSNFTLGSEKLYQIALGIAKGLEYLHRGCNTRILHFDIKPHNILLDENFLPKISDFGLAKLCPTKESVISMTGTRGTMGYIAPEVYCRNIGGVSHKSDVYSYGMMVLEMIGGRKNIDATVENTSAIYFPHWIYNQLKQEIRSEAMKLEISADFFKVEITKKMIIVALWCIQTHPADRPSMSKVLDMLEGKSEELQMPPNPFLDPQSRSPTLSSA